MFLYKPVNSQIISLSSHVVFKCVSCHDAVLILSLKGHLMCKLSIWQSDGIPSATTLTVEWIKVKLPLFTTWKIIGGYRRVALLIFNLDAPGGGWGPRYLLELVGSQSQSGRFREEQISCPYWDSNPGQSNSYALHSVEPRLKFCPLDWNLRGFSQSA